MSEITSLQIGQKKMTMGLIPSTSYVDLEIPSIPNDTSKDFIAPANGFYEVAFGPSGSSFSAGSIQNVTRHLGIEDADMEGNVGQYKGQRRIMQVLKGDTFRIYINAKSITSFKFIYAIGSEPKDN